MAEAKADTVSVPTTASGVKRSSGLPVVQRAIVTASSPPQPKGCCSSIPFHSIAVIFVYFSCTLLEWIFLSPWYVRTYSKAIYIPVLIVFALTTLTTLVNFSYASFMNPGYLPRAPDNRYEKRHPATILVGSQELKLKHCKTCSYYRMPRTVHCSTCDKCVDNFDHHCPWVNNCVGRRNYGFFFMFLVCVTSHLLFSTIFCIWALVHQPTIKNPFDPITVEIVSSFVVAVVSGLIFFPVAGLLGFHIFLISRGLTTYEQVTKKYDKGSPFHLGYCRNYALLLCGPEHPVFKSPSTTGKPTENDGSHAVQPALIAKFKQGGGTSSSDQGSPKFPLRKTERLDNIAKDSFDSNDNMFTFGSVGKENGTKASEEMYTRLDGLSDQSFPQDDVGSNFSIKVLSPASSTQSDFYVPIIANETGDLLCTLPTEISVEDSDGHMFEVAS